MKTNEFTNYLKGFPQNVIEWIEKKQVEQGNIPDASVLDRNIKAGKTEGGFDWGKTIVNEGEGPYFCIRLLFRRHFHILDEEPKTDIEHLFLSLDKEGIDLKLREIIKKLELEAEISRKMREELNKLSDIYETILNVEGWEPDWEDDTQERYGLELHSLGKYSIINPSENTRFVFPSKLMAKTFAEELVIPSSTRLFKSLPEK